MTRRIATYVALLCLLSVAGARESAAAGAADVVAKMPAGSAA